MRASIYLKAFASLFYSKPYIDDCVLCDFEKELGRNEQLRSASEAVKDKSKEKLKNTTLTRLALLRKQLVQSFCFLLTALVIGFFVLRSVKGVSLNHLDTPSRWFALISVFFFAWATLGRLGWQGQSHKGDTVFEALDDFIFRSLYWLGALCAVFAIVR